MQHTHVRKSFLLACMFVIISLAAFINPAKAGLDYYKIFLGKNLIYERYMNKPLSLQSLPITAANANETLTIYYYQCQTPNGTGSNRSIALKDEKGNIVKQWSFANVQGANNGMVIPVKELLQLQKTNKGGGLALYYTAEGRTEGEKLASIQPTSKEETYIQQQANYNLQIAWQVIHLLFQRVAVV